MFKKLLIVAVGGALALGLMSCQSDEDVTGPVSLEDDTPPGIQGTVYNNFGPMEGVHVWAVCYSHDPPEQVGPTEITDEDGWYSIRSSDFQYHEYHYFRVHWAFWDGGGWVQGSTDLFTYVPPVKTVNIYIPSGLPPDAGVNAEGAFGPPSFSARRPCAPAVNGMGLTVNSSVVGPVGAQGLAPLHPTRHLRGDIGYAGPTGRSPLRWPFLFGIVRETVLYSY